MFPLRIPRNIALLLVVAYLDANAGGSTASSAEIDFERQVLPILQAHCIDCHGPDTAEAQLRLDSSAMALRGGDSGERVIFAGDNAKSYLIERVSSDDSKKRMPPEDDPLTAEQIQTLKAWIEDASIWKAAQAELDKQKSDHWSFQLLKRPAPPSNAVHPIDAFLNAKLQKAGLAMSPPAERRRQIRRLYLVMHGLPPTPERVDQFVNDTRENAWELLVDEVLQSPRYGERWATFWLDLVRYGESHGFETNRERPNAWHYRDWVIQSLNDDKPYNEFVMEQIAGDSLGADLGTGFLVAGPYDLVKGQDQLLRLTQRQDELADMINTTGTAFLGLTLGCARCHNHKFDPVSQSDYYALQAVFAGVNHADRSLPLPADASDQVAKLDAQIARLSTSLTKFLRRPPMAHILIDDTMVEGTANSTRPAAVEYLVDPAGVGKNPPGTDRGFASDPGSPPRAGNPGRSANLSGGSYTWWDNRAGLDVAAYRPLAKGRYRVWLSWGAGWHSHTTDAKYLIDTDGDLKTTDDRRLLATVNQQRMSDGTGDVPGQSLWSGFYNAGIHELNTNHSIVLQGGDSEEAITSDVLLLEPVTAEEAALDADQQPLRPALRLPVNATLNEEHFPPTKTRKIRFTILATNASQPCIDELEIFAGDANVALAASGAKASSSGDFVHALHKLEHINDGQYGNGRSWIASSVSGGWVQIELPSDTSIDKIVWARDRQGKYSDRVAIDYRIEASLNGDAWQTLASSADRMSLQTKAPPAVQYDFTLFGEDDAQRGRRQLEELTRLQSEVEKLAKPTMAYVGTFSQPGPTHRLYRGEPTAPREQVAPGALHNFNGATLPPDSPEETRRLEIARWITSEQNPLTARVIVNRIWQHQFGVGIVDTPSDFGGNGGSPTHPELLDWLAVEMMENGWSIKHMQRLILTSAAWSQDSRPREDAVAIDASSRLLWRFPPRRLEAEGIRDSMLAVTGKLEQRLGGPGFSAFEVQLENVRHYFPKKNYGPEDWRRMIYMTKVRQERDSVFGVFDTPDCNQVVPKRSRSTTPLQALNLLNSSFVNGQAKYLVQRLEAESNLPQGRIVRAYELCFGRRPVEDEVELALEFIAATDWQQFARAMLNTNEFVFVP